MSQSKNKIPLGLLLKNAGLISNEQLQKALEVQSQYTQMKLGEILILQEGIRVKTINFFVYNWQNCVAQGQQFPIGYYLKNAALLDEKQVEIILQEQKSNQQKFGVVAAQKGWVRQSTIDFMLDSLSKSPRHMSLNSLEEYNNKTLHLEKKYANPSLILSRILAWTGGNASLSKTIAQVFAKSDSNIPAGSEIKAVDQFIEGSLIRRWQTSKIGEYLRSLKQNLVNNSRCDPQLLLQEYRTILLSDNQEYQHTPEQNELIALGLTVVEKNHLRVANIIYQQVFNQDFISQELSKKQLENQPKNITITQVNNKTQGTEITEYNPTILPQKIDIPEILEPKIIKKVINEETKTDSSNTKQNINTPDPLTKISSLVTLVAIALLIPLFLTINNYYSSLSKPGQKTAVATKKINQLAQFCRELNVTDANSSLKQISQLEIAKEELLRDFSLNSDAKLDSEIFPRNCEMSLNRLRVMVAPQLGRENRILEAIRHLCKVPADSEMYVEAEVWLQRWYNSSNWGQETQFYLQELTKHSDLNCPAAHFTEYES